MKGSRVSRATAAGCACAALALAPVALRVPAWLDAAGQAAAGA